MSDRPSEWTDTGHVYFIFCYCGGYKACAHKMGDTYEEVLQKWNTRGNKSTSDS